MQNMLEQGQTFGVGSIQLSFRTIVFTTCKDVFSPNVTTFQSNCAERLHFSAFHCYNYIYTLRLQLIAGTNFSVFAQRIFGIY